MPTNQTFDVKAIYDMLMYEIEPDLMSETIPFLDEFYEGETNEERVARGQRYVLAFEEAKRRFMLLIENAKHELTLVKKNQLSLFEERGKKADVTSSEELLNQA